MSITWNQLKKRVDDYLEAINCGEVLINEVLVDDFDTLDSLVIKVQGEPASLELIVH